MKEIMKKVSIFAIMLSLMVALSVQANAASKVKLNKTSVSIYVGENVTLKVSRTSKKVIWESSSKSVATVSNGKVTGKKAGTATITAKVEGKTLKCKVTVKTPYFTNNGKIIKSISVKKSGKLVSSTVTLVGNNIKSVRSSNSSIASATKLGTNKVVVKAVKKGSATISVAATNGKLYSFKINVIQLTTSISIKVDKSILMEGETQKAVVKVSPSAVSNKKVKWSSSDESVAEVDENGVITANNPGTAKITVETVDGSKKNASVLIKVNRSVESIELNIEDNSNKQIFSTEESEMMKKTVGKYILTLSDGINGDSLYIQKKGNKKKKKISSYTSVDRVICDGKNVYYCEGNFNSTQKIYRYTISSGKKQCLFKKMVTNYNGMPRYGTCLYYAHNNCLYYGEGYKYSNTGYGIYVYNMKTGKQKELSAKKLGIASSYSSREIGYVNSESIRLKGNKLYFELQRDVIRDMVHVSEVWAKVKIDTSK